MGDETEQIKSARQGEYDREAKGGEIYVFATEWKHIAKFFTIDRNA